MTKAKFLSVLLAVAMIFGCLPLVSSAVAGTGIDGLAVTAKLTVGVPYNGYVEETDPFLDTYNWSGYAKVFTVELEADKEYGFFTMVTGSDKAMADRAVSVVPADFEGDISRDAPAFNSGYTGRIATLYSPTESGTYYVIAWGYCDVYDEVQGDWISLFGEDAPITVLVEEGGDVELNIASAQDLIDFNEVALSGVYAAKNVTMYFQADIDMTGKEWDDNFLCGSVSVYGDGYTIKNLCGALLGETFGDVSVYELNMQLENITVASDYLYNFGFFATCSKNIYLNDCHITGNVTFEPIEASNVGMFVGYSDDVEIIGCSFEGDMTFNVSDYGSNFGGMVGFVQGYYTSISFCTVAANIDIVIPSDGDGYSECIGGLAGYIEDDAYISESSASVDINASYSYKIGGIAGYIDESNTITNCYTEGSIKGTGTLGGLVGNSNCCGCNVVKNCYSTVDVSGYTNVGGFFGCTYECEEFYNCYAAGTVTYLGENDPTDEAVGTFIGNAIYTDMVFVNCFAAESDGLNPIGYCDVSEYIPDISVTDFTDDSAVLLVEEALNGYVEENGYGELFYWKGRNAKNAPAFHNSNLESVEIVLNGFVAGGDVEFFAPQASSLDAYVEDFILCTDYNDPVNTAVGTGKLEADKTYYIGIMLSAEDPTKTFMTEYNQKASDVVGAEVSNIITEYNGIDYTVFYIEAKVPAIYEEGDVNGDGSVDVFDYMTVKSHYFKKYTLTDEEFARADLSPDGSIDVFDYMAVKSLVMAQ